MLTSTIATELPPMILALKSAIDDLTVRQACRTMGTSVSQAIYASSVIEEKNKRLVVQRKSRRTISRNVFEK